MDGAEPGCVVDEGESFSCPVTGRWCTSMRDWVSSTRRIGRGSLADCRRGGARGGGCREEAGDVLDDATAEDGEVQGAPVEAGRHIGRVYLDEELHALISPGRRRCAAALSGLRSLCFNCLVFFIPLILQFKFFFKTVIYSLSFRDYLSITCSHVQRHDHLTLSDEVISTTATGLSWRTQTRSRTRSSSR